MDDAVLTEKLEAIRAELRDAIVDRTRLHDAIERLVAHVDRQNGRIAKLEREVHEEQLALARREATQEAQLGIRRRDIAVASGIFSVVAVVAPILAQVILHIT